MTYSDSIEESSEYLRLALDHMGRHRIPVDPANYSVWYEYVSGKNSQIKLVLDCALTKPDTVTPDFSRSLYERYIANEHRIIIKKIRKELGNVLESLLTHIIDAGGELTRFGTMINDYSRKLRSDLDAESVRAIVDDILSETEVIRHSSLILKERIISSTREIENLRRDLDKVREEAWTDMLTGLKNRRYLTNLFEQESGHASETGKPLSLIMIDIDHFKHINDIYGHIMGDQVLKTAAAMIRNCVKGRDTVIRFGGEEFVVILPDTPLKGAVILAEQICAYFKNMNWKRKDTGETIGRICVSIGVSQYRKGEPLEMILHRADSALYLSKTTGRGKVTSEASIREEPSSTDA